MKPRIPADEGAYEPRALKTPAFRPVAGLGRTPAEGGRLPSADLEPARTVAVVNQKGGVGKTTTAFHLAGALAEAGKNVLLVDLDPQANLTDSVGVDLPPDALSSEDLFLDEAVRVPSLVRTTAFPRIDVLPARTRLAGVDLRIAARPGREAILERRLAPLRNQYGVILLDCPPSLSLITVNALCACAEVIVPFECQPYSIRAISELSKTVAVVRERAGKPLSLRFLPTKIDARLTVAAEILETVRAWLGDRVLPPIRTDASLMRAAMRHEPVARCFPRSKAAEDYARLAAVLLHDACS